MSRVETHARQRFARDPARAEAELYRESVSYPTKTSEPSLPRTFVSAKFGPPGARSQRRRMPRVTKKSETTPTVRVKRTRRSTDASAAAAITEAEISRLAYELYQARGGTNGSPLDDWLEAERQLAGR